MREEEIINNMCLTWAHNFGLLDESEKQFLFNQMKQLFENNIKNELVMQWEVDEYVDEYNEKIELLCSKTQTMQELVKTSIEEIKYALAKPQYAEVYLNNAIRFLNGCEFEIGKEDRY